MVPLALQHNSLTKAAHPTPWSRRQVSYLCVVSPSVYGQSVCVWSVRLCMVSYLCVVSPSVYGQLSVCCESVCIWSVCLCVVSPSVYGQLSVCGQSVCVWSVICVLWVRLYMVSLSVYGPSSFAAQLINKGSSPDAVEPETGQFIHDEYHFLLFMPANWIQRKLVFVLSVCCLSVAKTLTLVIIAFEF